MNDLSASQQGPDNKVSRVLFVLEHDHRQFTTSGVHGGESRLPGWSVKRRNWQKTSNLNYGLNEPSALELLPSHEIHNEPTTLIITRLAWNNIEVNEFVCFCITVDRNYFVKRQHSSSYQARNIIYKSGNSGKRKPVRGLKKRLKVMQFAKIPLIQKLQRNFALRFLPRTRFEWYCPWLHFQYLY